MVLYQSQLLNDDKASGCLESRESGLEYIAGVGGCENGTKGETPSPSPRKQILKLAALNVIGDAIR